jgi:hypothetical protein
MDLWELAARERIRDTLARYSWSGDSLRLDEFAHAFCEDGELQLRGRDPVRGRAAVIDSSAVSQRLTPSRQDRVSPASCGTT